MDSIAAQLLARQGARLAPEPSMDDDSILDEMGSMGLGALQKIGDFLSSPSRVITNTLLGTMELAEGNSSRALDYFGSAGRNALNFGGNVASGGLMALLAPSPIREEDRNDYSKVLRALGMEKDTADYAGFGLDVVADPLNLVTLGGGAGMKLAAHAGLDLTEEALTKTLARGIPSVVDGRRVLRRVPLDKASAKAVEQAANTPLNKLGIKELDRRTEQFTGFWIDKLKRSRELAQRTGGGKEGSTLDLLLKRTSKDIAGKKFTLATATDEQLEAFATQMARREASRDLTLEVAASIKEGARGIGDLPPGLSGLFDRMGLKIGLPSTERATVAFADQSFRQLYGKTLAGRGARALVKAADEVAPELTAMLRSSLERTAAKFIPNVMMKPAQRAFLRETIDHLNEAGAKARAAVNDVFLDKTTGELLVGADREALSEMLEARIMDFDDAGEMVVVEAGPEAWIRKATDPAEAAERLKTAERLRPRFEQLRTIFDELPKIEAAAFKAAEAAGIPASELGFAALRYYVPHIYTQSSLQKYLKARGWSMEELFQATGPTSHAGSQFRKGRIIPTLEDVETASKNNPIHLLEPVKDSYLLTMARVNAHVRTMEYVRAKGRFQELFRGATSNLDQINSAKALQSMLDSEKVALIDKEAAKRQQVRRLEFRKYQRYRETLEGFAGGLQRGVAQAAKEDPFLATAAPGRSSAHGFLSQVLKRRQEQIDRSYDFTLKTLAARSGRATANLEEAEKGLAALEARGRAPLLDEWGSLFRRTSRPEARPGEYPLLRQLLGKSPQDRLHRNDLQQAWDLLKEGHTAIDEQQAAMARKVKDLRERVADLKAVPEKPALDDADYAALQGHAHDLASNASILWRNGALSADTFTNITKRLVEIEGESKALANKLAGLPELTLDDKVWNQDFLKRALDEQFQAQEKLHGPLGLFEGATKHVKGWLTKTFPSFHVRNVVSGMISGAIDPAVGWKVLRSLVPGGRVDRILQGVTNEAVQAGATRFTGDQVLALAQQFGVLGRGEISTELAGQVGLSLLKPTGNGGVGIGGKTGVVEQAKAAKDFLVGKDGIRKKAFGIDPERNKFSLRSLVPFINDERAAVPWVGPYADALGEWVGEALEDRMRMGSFIAGLESGLDPAQAAANVGRFFVDYRYTSQAERVARTIIPFYKFNREMIPTIIAEVARRPIAGKPIQVGALLQNKLEQDGVLIPPFLEGKLTLPIGEDANGDPIYISGLGTPFEPLELIPRSPLQGGTRRDLQRAASTINPILKVPFEEFAEINLFFGGPRSFYDRAPEAFNSLPGPLKDLLGVKKLESGRTVMSPAVRQLFTEAPPTARTSFEIMRLLDERKSPEVRALTALTGLRTTTADQERESIRRMRELLTEKMRAGTVRELPVFYVPEQFKETKEGQQIDALIRTLREKGKSRRDSQSKGIAQLLLQKRRSLTMDGESRKERKQQAFDLFSTAKER